MLDVGQGDCVLIQSSTGRSILIDAGPRSSRLIPELKSLGVNSLDLAVLTHLHPDHGAGFAKLLDLLPIRTRSDNGYPYAGREEAIELPLNRFRRQPGYRALKGGDVLTVGEITLTALWPLTTPKSNDDWNYSSLVLLVQFGKFRVLMMGDVMDRVERQLAARFGTELRAQVLKAAHHGSSSTAHPLFLDFVQPQVVLISVADLGRYGSSETMTSYTRHGASVLTTKSVGTITLKGCYDGRVLTQEHG